MVSTTKLAILAILGFFAMVLGTCALFLTMTLNQRKRELRARRRSQKEKHKATDDDSSSLKQTEEGGGNTKKGSGSSSSNDTPGSGNLGVGDYGEGGNQDDRNDNDEDDVSGNFNLGYYAPHPNSARATADAQLQESLKRFAVGNSAELVPLMGETEMLDGTGGGGGSSRHHRMTSMYGVDLLMEGAGRGGADGSGGGNMGSNDVRRRRRRRPTWRRFVDRWTSSSSSSFFSYQDDLSSAEDSESTYKRTMRSSSSSSVPPREAYRLLEESATNGNPLAQYLWGNLLASTIFLPMQSSSGQELIVPTDFGASPPMSLINWHYAAVAGHVESQLAMAYRHYQSYKKAGKYGIEGATCQTSLAYYEEAAHGVMDELESGVWRGKVRPAEEGHRLAEIHFGGGPGNVLHLPMYNRPDELDEALEYYRTRATASGLENPFRRGSGGDDDDDDDSSSLSVNTNTQADVKAALTLANFHHFGHRGVVQDLGLALHYYEIAADGGSKDAAAVAGTFHLHGVGYTDDELKRAKTRNAPASKNNRFQFAGDVRKAWKYLQQAVVPRSHEGRCDPKFYKAENGDTTAKVPNCNGDALNGLGLMYLVGVPPMVQKPNVTVAFQYFNLAKNKGIGDASYHIGMMRMGWRTDWRPQAMRKTTSNNKNTNEVKVKPPAQLQTKGGSADASSRAAAAIPNNNNMQENNLDEDDDNENLNMILDDFDVDDVTIIEGNFAEMEEILRNLGVPDASFVAKAANLAALSSNAKGSSDGNNNNGKGVKAISVKKKRDDIHDINRAIKELLTASTKGHLQATHRLGTIYSHGIRKDINDDEGDGDGRSKGKYMIKPNCDLAVDLFRQVIQSSPTTARTLRRAYKLYVAGDVNAALRNYMAAAETGSEVGMVNAAWILERHCPLHDDPSQHWRCKRASLRYWREATRLGDAEALMNLGDFFYYDRLGGPERHASIGGAQSVSMAAPLTTTTNYERFRRLEEFWNYVLFPEKLFGDGKEWLFRATRNFLLWQRRRRRERKLASLSLSHESHGGNGDVALTPTPVSKVDSGVKADGELDSLDNSNGPTTDSVPIYSSDQNADSPASNDGTDVKANMEGTIDLEGYIVEGHLQSAASYYRRAAKEHNSPRANFNLGFMHQWGIGLKQDFPLAKRHYDLAVSSSSSEASIAVQFALWGMYWHETTVRLRPYCQLNWFWAWSASNDMSASTVLIIVVAVVMALLIRRKRRT